MGIPKYRQAAKDIAEYIRINRMRPGEKLPGGRRLTEMFGVSKNTAYEALEFLCENKIIEIREKAGCYVAKKARERMDKINWDSYLDLGWQDTPSARSFSTENVAEKTINLCSISAHESFGYYDCFLKALDILRSGKDNLNLLQNADIQGSPSLRQAIADNMLKECGIKAKPSNIILNSGVEGSVDIFVRGLLSRGDTIYTEEPATFPLYTLATAIGVNVVTLPMDEEGIDIDALKRGFRKSGRAILLVTTFCHIPTGINMSVERRREVLEFCTLADIPIIEIDCQWYPDKKFKPIRAMDESGGGVIYSRGIFMPATLGMSIGWVVLPDNLVPKISDIYAQTSPHPFNLNGRILEIMLREGIYEEFLRQLYPKFESRRLEVCRLLSEHLSPYASWSTDRIVFWVKLADNIDTVKLFHLNKNLIILSGIIYGKKFEQYIFLLPYALSDIDLKAGIESLLNLIKRCIK